jgi:hypothetical protein
MVTYAQLQAEPAWNAEVVTPEFRWLIDNLCEFYGVPRGNGGAKGDNRHFSGGHRSQRWILTSRFCTNRSYSVEGGLGSGLVDCIAAFDITLPPAAMRAISQAADRATRSGQLEELVEWFGQTDTDNQVEGWDNIRNQVDSSDSSHLWHFHGRLRRSILRSMAAMRKIFAALTGQDADMDTEQARQLSNTHRLVLALARQQNLATGVVEAGYSDAVGRAEVPAITTLVELRDLARAARIADAEDKARDEVMLSAIRALTVATGADPQPIIDAIERVGATVAEVRGTNVALVAEIEALRQSETDLRARLATAFGSGSE